MTCARPELSGRGAALHRQLPAGADKRSVDIPAADVRKHVAAEQIDARVIGPVSQTRISRHAPVRAYAPRRLRRRHPSGSARRVALSAADTGAESSAWCAPIVPGRDDVAGVLRCGTVGCIGARPPQQHRERHRRGGGRHACDPHRARSACGGHHSAYHTAGAPTGRGRVHRARSAHWPRPAPRRARARPLVGLRIGLEQ